MTLKTILIIDDSEAEQYLYQATINSLIEDVEILSAYDGVEGLELLASLSKKPDCILVDINMPRMNGLQFLEEYSKIYKDESIMITMMTSSIHPADKEKALQHKCVKDFFIKPLGTADIEQLIQYAEETKT